MSRKNKDIIDRAQQRFNACVSWEQGSRSRFKDDIQFLFADPDNQEQWNAAVRASRQLAGQPMVTINKTHTHWLHVVNEMLENKPAIKISPTGGQSTYDSAQIYASVVRSIENKSKAQIAYKTAARFQVGGGIGYWFLDTGYVDEDSFDQEIRIKPVPDPLCVYLDPNIKMADGSDAKFGFIFEEMSRKDAEAKFGDIASKQLAFDGLMSWAKKDTIVVANYYEVETAREWLYALKGDDESVTMIRESEAPSELLPMLKQQFDEGNAERRKVDKRQVKKYLILGNEVLEKGDWAGKYIPIIRVPGEETVLEGRLDRKGLVRYLKDAQRAYNYNASAALEFGALQSKSPYIGPLEAFEGLENYWATANTQNHAFLPYNNADENGNPITPPARQQPPSSAPVYMDGMQVAEHELMMASGQYEATFSEQGNEVSGISIEQRQKQGARVTYHFQDAMADAIAFTGVQLIDLIPKIYDTKRIVRIIAEDGEEQMIQIDPSQKDAVQQNEDEGENEVKAIFNPSVGTYDVVAEVGPNFETKRQQAFDAMTQLIAAQPMLAQIVGDLYMGTADFPVADKLQERMLNWIKSSNPAVLGEGPTQQEQAMQQQIQQLSQALQAAHQMLNDRSVEHQLQQKRVDIDALNHLALRMENDNKAILDAFKAESDRLKPLVERMSDEALSPIVRKAVAEIMAAHNPDAGVMPDLADPANTYAAGMQSVLAPIQDQQAAQQTT